MYSKLNYYKQYDDKGQELTLRPKYGTGHKPVFSDIFLRQCVRNLAEDTSKNIFSKRLSICELPIMN